MSYFSIYSIEDLCFSNTYIDLFLPYLVRNHSPMSKITRSEFTQDLKSKIINTTKFGQILASHYGPWTCSGYFKGWASLNKKATTFYFLLHYDKVQHLQCILLKHLLDRICRSIAKRAIKTVLSRWRALQLVSTAWLVWKGTAAGFYCMTEKTSIATLYFVHRPWS